MAHTYTWNSSFEASPSDNNNARDGALRIRQLKEAISERMELDHSWDPTNPDADDDGKHIKTTFLERASSPTQETSAFILFSKDDGTQNELHGIDEAGNELQITKAGKFNLLNTVNAFTKGQTVEEVTLTDGGTVTPDLDDGNIFTWTIEGNRTLANPSNMDGGSVITIIVKQDGTGGRTITYGSKWLFPSGIDSNPADGANEYSVITGVYSATYDVIIANIAKDFA